MHFLQQSTVDGSIQIRVEVSDPPPTQKSTGAEVDGRSVSLLDSIIDASSLWLYL